MTVCRYATVCLLIPHRLYLAYHFSSSVCSGPLRRSGRLAVIEGKGEAKVVVSGLGGGLWLWEVVVMKSCTDYMPPLSLCTRPPLQICNR